MIPISGPRKEDEQQVDCGEEGEAKVAKVREADDPAREAVAVTYVAIDELVGPIL